MKYAIVIDSSAALPEGFIKDRPIKMLPLMVDIDGEAFPDYTSEKKLLKIYASGKINVRANITTSPPSQEEIKDYFLHDIVPNYDVAICQTVANNVSTTYESISEVAHSIALDSRELRNKLGIDHPFRITYMNTGTTGAGHGLVAVFADVVLSKGMEFGKYKEQVEKFRKVVKGFTVVKDIVYSRHRSRLRGQDVINLPTALIGKAVGLSPIVLIQNNVVDPVTKQVGFSKAVNRLFDYAIDRMEEGLHLNCINVSYAGPPVDLEQYSSFTKLQERAEQAGVILLVGVLSLATAVNFSPGCIALGIAPRNHTAVP